MRNGAESIGRTRSSLKAGIAIAAFAVARATPALAQAGQAATPEAQQASLPDQVAAPDDGRGDVVVTGSRIARDGYQAPTPVTVLTTAEIQNQSPSNNIADLVNQQPALAGSTKPANSRLNLSSGQAGINALNLRNLGEVRTLVLVDGHRSVASTITGLVDINTIPQALVERVEIVTGGASAVYGSDAVAGVVNFILDKRYDGLKLSADNGITDYGDGHNYSFSGAAGRAFAGGRGHILLSGEYAHRDGIFSIDRDWNATGYLRIQDPAWVAGASTPKFLVRRQIGAANSTPGGIVTLSSGGTANRLRGLYFGSGGQVQQYQYGALSYPAVGASSAPTLTQGGSWQVNDSGRRIGLDPDDTRWGAFGRASFDLSDGVELYAEAAYNRQHIVFNSGPNLSTGSSTGSVLTTTGCGTAATAATAPLTCNAFAYNTLGPATLAGVNSFTYGTTAADLPYRVVDNTRRVQRYQAGADGHLTLFGKRATWDLYGQYGQADLHEGLRNIMNLPRIQAASAAAFAPAGNARGYPTGSIQCLVNVDASTANDDPNCVALNRLGIGVASPAAIAYVLGNPYRDEVSRQWSAGANLQATPFATWAGDVSVAVGAEYRSEQITGFVPAEFQPVSTTAANGNITTTNVWSVGNFLPTNGYYDVKEAYLETVVPLGLGLEFNGAVRATDYSTSGYVTTWKVGGTWQPIPDIRLRVTRSRDIRAPNLNELYQAGSANSDSVTNPIYVANGANGPATYGYTGIATGNPALKPEFGDTWNLGGVITPRFLPGFALSVDYFDIDIKGEINSFSAQQIVNLCYQQNVQAFCDAITVDATRSTAAAPYLVIRTQPFNAAKQAVRGIDIEGSYRLPLSKLFARSPAAVTLRGLATRYLTNYFDSGVIGAAPVLNSVGVNSLQSATPKWLFRGSATYETPSFSFTVVGRGVSGGKYSAYGIQCTTACPTSYDTVNFYTTEDNHISGLFYADLNVTEKIAIDGKSFMQVFANVANLFNRPPMLLPETGLAANPTYSDLLGRQYRVGVRVQLR